MDWVLFFAAFAFLFFIIWDVDAKIITEWENTPITFINGKEW